MIDNFKVVENYIKEIEDSKNKLKIILKKLGIESYGETGNYLLLDLKSSENAIRFAVFMKSKKIYIKGPWKDNYSNFLTITLGPMKLMEKFVGAVEEFNLR